MSDVLNLVTSPQVSGARCKKQPQSHKKWKFWTSKSLSRVPPEICWSETTFCTLNRDKNENIPYCAIASRVVRRSWLSAPSRMAPSRKNSATDGFILLNLQIYTQSRRNNASRTVPRSSPYRKSDREDPQELTHFCGNERGQAEVGRKPWVSSDHTSHLS